MSKINQQKATEFLPAALSLEHKPASPAGRLILWVMVLVFSSTVAWASIGEVDIVAIAHGKIIPNGQTRPVQAAVKAEVLSLAVKEGQLVEAGDLLIQLNDAEAKAESKRLGQRYQQVWEDENRYQVLLEMLEQGEELKTSTTDHLLKNTWMLYQDKVKNLHQQQDRHVLEYKRMQLDENKYREILPIVRHKETNLKKLAENNLASKKQYLDQKQIRMETEQ